MLSFNSGKTSLWKKNVSNDSLNKVPIKTQA